MITTFVRILRPDYDVKRGRDYETPLESDYIVIPRLETFGVYKVRDMLSQDSWGALAGWLKRKG